MARCEAGWRSLRFLCLLAATEGVAHFHREHPDVPLYTAAVDEKLDEHGYILLDLGMQAIAYLALSKALNKHCVKGCVARGNGRTSIALGPYGEPG